VDENGRRDLYNGFGDTLARGFEMAATPAIFGAGGYFVDRYFGILPVCTILFTIVCVVGMFVRAYYGYAEAMKAHEENAPWRRGSRS
jgi:hypothetical protein